MLQKLIAGNWKMNGSLAANQALLADLLAGLAAQAPACQVAVAVPAPYLAQVQQLTAGSAIALGAQDVSQHASGAFTGETSAQMLNDFGVRYALVGHSERRQYHGESSELVAEKFQAAAKAGLQPILCVGEKGEDRDAGRETLFQPGKPPLRLGLAGVDAFANAVLAYEPVWAIGTGRSASVAQVAEVHAAIRAWLKAHDVARGVRILYGGSVKPDNAAAIFAVADVDGGLIGGASLVAADFMAICRAAAGGV